MNAIEIDLAKLPNKQVVLFAADMARLLLPDWKYIRNDDRPEWAIGIAEMYGISRNCYNDKTALRLAEQAVKAAIDATDNLFYEEDWAAARDASRAALFASWTAQAVIHSITRPKQTPLQMGGLVTQYLIPHYTNAANTYEACQPEREWDENWNTKTTLSLAKQIIENKDWAAMPILLDALEDMGCVIDRWFPVGLSHWALYNLRG